MPPFSPLAPDETLLGRYVAGLATAEERQRVVSWVGDDLERRALLRDLQRAWDVTPMKQTATDADVARVWARVRAASVGREETVERGVRRVEKPERQSSPWGVWSVTAVSCVVLAIVLLLGWGAGVRRFGMRESTSYLTYTTSPGQRANITLPDGSTVVLNVGSRLDVASDYTTGHHTVRLAGEALFTVTHHDRAPFTVMAGQTAVRVLGTSFVVRDYANDGTTLVAVHDGKVAVRSLVLTASRQVEVSGTAVGRVQPADPAQFSFATGVLTLNQMPLPAAIEELNRWYNADIRLADPTLRAQRMTAKLTAGSLTDLTAILEMTFDVRVVRSGRVLTLYPR